MRIYSIIATAIALVFVQQASAWEVRDYSSRSVLSNLLRELRVSLPNERHSHFAAEQRVPPRPIARQVHRGPAAEHTHEAPPGPGRFDKRGDRHFSAADRHAESHLHTGHGVAGRRLGSFGRAPSGFGVAEGHSTHNLPPHWRWEPPRGPRGHDGRHGHAGHAHHDTHLPPRQHHRPGNIVDCPVPLYPRVEVEDANNIAPGAVPIVVAVRNPRPRFGPECVYVRVFAPACPPRRVEVSDRGRYVRLDYGKYEVEIEADDGRIEIEYDD